MGSRWTPGHKRTPAGMENSIRKVKNMSRHVTMWNMVLTLTKTPEGEDDYKDSYTSEFGDTVNMHMRWSGHPGFQVQLCALTEAELDVLQEYMIDAITTARPIVRARDMRAKEAERNGDYSFFRSVRQSPRVVVVQRQVGQHNQSVHNRYQDALPGDVADDDLPFGAGGDFSPLVELETTDSGS